ncbi:MAG: uracil-DNA glycosylase [Proteobacteria bacterium]|nr:uracil-DNA glycosylase [Pseudomonadota bacterium]
MAKTSQTEKEQIAQLAWQVEMGADEVISEVPINRLLAARPEKTPATETKAAETKAPQTKAPQTKAAPAKAQAAAPPPEAAEQEAGDLAAKAKTLAELNGAIAAFEGCSLKKTAMSTVFARGGPASGLMLVGEAPGAAEDRQGKPFVGPAGKLLDKMLAAIGRTSEADYYISNVLPGRPPGNRNPTPAEAAICLPFIRRHIELAAPRVLVMLGGVAAKALLDVTDGITRVRGRWFCYSVGEREIPAMAIFHPAYLLRQPQLKRQAWQDLLEIKSKLDG